MLCLSVSHRDARFPVSGLRPVPVTLRSLKEYARTLHKSVKTLTGVVAYVVASYCVGACTDMSRYTYNDLSRQKEDSEKEYKLVLVCPFRSTRVWQSSNMRSEYCEGWRGFLDDQLLFNVFGFSSRTRSWGWRNM